MVGKKVEGNEDQRRAAAREARREGDETASRSQSADDSPVVDFSGRGHPDYTDEHAKVFTALTMAQEEHNGEAVYLDQIADGAGLPEDQTRVLLHDLVTVHRLVTELQGTDNPDMGPRFEVKPRL